MYTQSWTAKLIPITEGRSEPYIVICHDSVIASSSLINCENIGASNAFTRRIVLAEMRRTDNISNYTTASAIDYAKLGVTPFMYN